MAKVITEMNPKPMKLKFEKVFFHLVKQIFEKNTLCKPESFNTNISHQLFEHKITFVSS